VTGQSFPLTIPAFPDTIVAISTPPGRGGIGIVRLSGADARAIAVGVLRLAAPLEHGMARLADVLEAEPAADGQRRLDEAVVTYFQAPRSYTREDVVEIAAHGSPVVLDAIVRACLARGARLARPGEFTERAFLSGRMDLMQAEAVRDLIDAQTVYQARIASEQMEGSLSRAIQPIKRALVGLVAELEAGIDFAEDDIAVMPADAITRQIEAVRAPLAALAAGFAYGRLLRDGFTMAIVGLPNTGKSSLFNRLIERDRAIVTDTPGTTRDTISERVALAGIPLELIDTAGLRDAPEVVERLGIERSRAALAEADIVLVVLDATASALAAEERALLEQTMHRTMVVVLNKCDLGAGGVAEEVRAAYPAFPANAASALTGEGIPGLRTAILRHMQQPGTEAGGALMTNLRQQTEVNEALAALATAQQAVGDSVPHEMLLLDLYSALRHLDALTGETRTDDILNVIFSSFCIGK
jgi:tRNA modification GTPase